MKGIRFLNNPHSLNSDTAFVAHLSDINSENELLKQLNKQLKFPEYFGFNWNALYDCLRDFHWIEEHKIILVHDNDLSLSDPDFSIYLQILFDSVEDWKEGEEHTLEVVFPESMRDLIQQYYP